MIFDKKIKKGLFREGIKASVLELLVNNKGQFFTIKQIRERIMKERPFIFDIRCLVYLGLGHGLYGSIGSSIHSLREKGHFIVSSAEHGKGYCYINPNDYMSPDYWDSKFLANEKREDIPKVERKTDEFLFQQCLAKCDSPEIRKRMRVVAESHSIDVKEEKKLAKLEEDDDDDE